jgi:hypothetical protein
MSTESKIRIYKTCMRPMLTYAAEIQTGTSKTKQLLRSAEMRVLRNIKGVTLRDRIRNDEGNVIDVGRWVRIRRRNWRDHLDRMVQERCASWAKHQKPSTNRPTGRSPKNGETAVRQRQKWIDTNDRTESLKRKRKRRRRRMRSRRRKSSQRVI